MNRVRLKYIKGDDLRWLSHLDVARSWKRIIARAGLPVKYSEGFSPHPRVSMGPALAVGISSEAEYIDILMEPSIEADLIMNRLGRAAPKDLRVLKVKEIPAKTPSLGSSIVCCDMNVEIKGSLRESVIKEAWQSDKTPFLRLLGIDEKISFTMLSIRLPINLKVSLVVERLGESAGQEYRVTKVDKIAQWVSNSDSLIDPLEV